MKVKFICETCGKEFENREGACECEAKHVSDKVREERLAKEKSERKAHILELWNSYLEDYNEYPIETITKDFPFIRFFGF